MQHLCSAEHGRPDGVHHAVERRHAADGAALNIERQTAVVKIRLHLRLVTAVSKSDFQSVLTSVS